MSFERLKLRKEAVAYKLRTRSEILPVLIVLLNEFGGLFFGLWRFIVHRRIHTSEPRRILVIRADRIGDMILTTPMFKALKERYPKAHI
ncbi:unnamed protein product, partial [marine sediment metagenome]